MTIAVYTDPPGAVTIMKLPANRAYGTVPEMSANRAAECIKYLTAITKSLS